MLSLGIIWPPAQEFKDDILNDIGNMVNLKYYTNIDLGVFYHDFIYNVYENEVKYKVDKKYKILTLSPKTVITIVLFDFDEASLDFHKQKNRFVYKQLNDLKVYIRETYGKKIDNYYFDNVFHCTDDFDEYKHSEAVIKKQLNQLLSNVLKLASEKERAKVYVKRKN